MNYITGKVYMLDDAVLITPKETLEKLATTLGYNYRWLDGILLYKNNPNRGFLITTSMSRGTGSNWNSASLTLQLFFYENGDKDCCMETLCISTEGINFKNAEGVWEYHFYWTIKLPYIKAGNAVGFGLTRDITCCSAIGKKIPSGTEIWCHLYNYGSGIGSYNNAYLMFVKVSDESQIESRGQFSDYGNRNRVLYAKNRASQDTVILSPCYLPDENIVVENVYISEKFPAIVGTLEFEMNGYSFVSLPVPKSNYYDTPRLVIRTG